MKAKVPLYRTNPTRAVLIDTEATQGAVVGVNLFNQDGSLYVPPSAGAAAPGTGIALDDVQVLGPQSVTVTGSIAEGAVTVAFDGDTAAPGNTYLYSTGLTGTKGWNALSSMLHQSANVAVTFGVDGTATFDLQPLTDSGAGTFKLITRDSYGRLAGTKAGTTSDVPEGTNLYYTDARADARIGLQKGQPNGIATLDANSKLDAGQLPALAITETFVVSTQAAMLALAAQQGDVCVRTDLHDSFILTTNDPTVLANWQQLETPVDGVASFNGRTGSVTPASGDYNTTQVAEGSSLYFTAARVLATALSGLSTATNAVITAADSVLVALGKLQAQITANVAALAGKLTASNNLSDVANAAAARTNLGLANAATVAHAESVAAETFFTGDGTTSSAPLTINGYTVVNPTVTAMHQTDWQGRQLLYPTARTNVFTQSEFPNGLADTNVSGGNVSAASGLSWNGGITTGIAFTSNSATSFAYKNSTLGSTPATVTFSCVIKMDDGGAPVIGGNTNSDFSFAINNALQSADTIIPLAGGLYRCSRTIVYTGSSPNVGVVKYTTQSARTFVVSAYDLKVASKLSGYIKTGASAVTVTDYAVDSSGNVTLGQSPAVDATLDWDGSGTARYPASFGGPVTTGQYTLATLPSASAYEYATIVVTNATGGPALCLSDGTTWNNVRTGSAVS